MLTEGPLVLVDLIEPGLELFKNREMLFHVGRHDVINEERFE